MSLLFMESFAHYLAADYPQKNNGLSISNSISATGGRRGVPALQGGNGTFYTRTFIPGDTTCIIGFAINFSIASTADIIRIYDSGGNETYHIGLNSTRTIYCGKPFAAPDATSTLTITVPGFIYFEAKVNVLDAGGTVDVKVNGVSFISLTGIDTKFSGTAGWNRIDIISGSFPTLLHDMYVCDGTGGAPWNNLLGDSRVDVRRPTANTASGSIGWTPSTGSNFQNVDDVTPNGDTDYNSTSSIATDVFVTEDAPVVGGTIFGIQLVTSNKKMDGGACGIKPVIRHSGTEYLGNEFFPTLSYTMMIQAYQTNPGTGLAWTEAGFNAAEFGYKRSTVI